MDLHNLIDKANLGALDTPSIEEASRNLGVTVEELCDLVAKTISLRYLEGTVAWQYGDNVMNSLYSWAYGPSDVCLSDFAWDVYIAFDEGEYIHKNSSPELDGEPRTKILLYKLLGTENA